MAKGDGVNLHSSVGAGSYLDVQPAGTAQYLISSVWSEGQIEVYMTDGTNHVLVEEVLTSPYALHLYKFTLSNTYYLKIKNIESGAKYVGCSGITLKA